MKYIIPKLHSTSFDWLSWRNGSIIDFNIACREEIILNNAEIFRKYAIGYLPSEELYCRPKYDEVAVLFSFNDKEFWFHLRKKEFNLIFKDE